MAALLATMACGDKVPSGQAVATVNDEDITQSELDFELASAQVGTKDRTKAKPLALQLIVNRKLLAQEAKKRGIDKQPDVILAERRSVEMMLAQKVVQTLAVSLQQQQPTQIEINSYRDKHPALGAGRRVLVIDQIRFAAPSNAAEIATFEPVRTMNQLAQLLASRSARVDRATIEVDSATLNDEAFAKLMMTQSGEPLIAIRGSVALANVVIASHPVIRDGVDTTVIAKRRILSEKFEKMVKQNEQRLRDSAKIIYADGFAPKLIAAPATNR